MINQILSYFDLQSASRGGPAKAQGDDGQPHKVAPVIPQYVALALGVIADPFLRHYQATGDFGQVWPTLVGRTVFGFLIAIVILPAVYKRAFDPDRPTLVQLAALFVSGLGWQSLFQAAVKAGQSVS